MLRNLFICLSLTVVPLRGFAGHEFALPEAMTAAGEQVPSAVENYSFFYIQSPDNARKDIDELAHRLIEAAREKEYVGLAGPNPEWTRSVLRGALAANDGFSLDGLVLVYLGPQSDLKLVRDWIAASGADVRYVVFP